MSDPFTRSTAKTGSNDQVDGKEEALESPHGASGGTFMDNGAIPPITSASSHMPARASASDQAFGAPEHGARPHAHPPDKKVARLRLFTDIEATHLGLKELQAHRVGHTWLAIEYLDPTTVPESVPASHKPLLEQGGRYADSMGFWPDTVAPGETYQREGHHPFNGNPLNSYVPGAVHHPDHAHQGREKATESWELTQTEVDAVIRYAESKKSTQYSVYFYNCTTFALEAVSAAGKAAPSLPLMMPNALYSAIKARQKAGVGDTMTKDYDGKNEVDVHGPDESEPRGPTHS